MVPRPRPTLAKYPKYPSIYLYSTEIYVFLRGLKDGNWDGEWLWNLGVSHLVGRDVEDEDRLLFIPHP